MPLAFILGNPWAAQKEQRFIDKDLNRSFGATGLTDAEGRAIFELKRAKDLEPTLAQSTYILDFHQTTRASDRPFFIFPYSAASFQWARRIAPRITVVTHWGKPFSSEGRCSDEYVNGCGGIGITMELGQNGLDTYQIAAGVEAALWSIRAVQANLQGATGKLRAVDDAEQGEIFTWGQIVPWPAVGLVDLRPDWHNFKMVQAGESLGTVDGKPLVAETSGRILFPKYLSHAEQRVLVSRPTELCRIMKNINVSDLPTA
jgi:succinylglutamate desuccinylase